MIRNHAGFPLSAHYCHGAACAGPRSLTTLTKIAMNTRVENQSTEEVVDNLRKLISEAEAAISGDISTKSEEMLTNLRERLETGLHSLDGYYSEAKKSVAAGARKTDEAIRTHPYESLAVALGVGVLIGALVRRS